ncbi:helix-turn-helix transcriptional regulator [Moritella sp.]|uniref:S24 family peptidase n=1 Tax=Moritella sp. TaxID=78556 RepID=UPI00341381A1
MQLPFYEISASAGVGLLAEIEDRPKSISFEPSWLRSEIGVCPNNVFLMLVDGDSMLPTLKNGSMIMVNRDVDNLSDGVYVMRHDNNLLVKRLQMLPGGIIRVKSDNSMYDPWQITKSQLDGEELALIGRVFGLDRRCDFG